MLKGFSFKVGSHKKSPLLKLNNYNQNRKRTIFLLALFVMVYAIFFAWFLHQRIPHQRIHNWLNTTFATTSFQSSHDGHSSSHSEVIVPGGGFGQAQGTAKTTTASAAFTLAGFDPAEPGRIIHADVLAIEQPVIYNRFGSANPYSMMYALKHDVVKHDGGEWLAGINCPGRVKLRENKRPRPLVLRANVGDTLEITFTNLLMPEQPDLSSCQLEDQDSPYSQLLEDVHEGTIEEANHQDETTEFGSDWPRTRNASITIQGLRPEDGTDVKCTGLESIAPVPDNIYEGISDLNDVPSSYSVTCRWHIENEGTFLFYSHGAPAGGNGDGGSLVQGLFGSVNVEPKGSHWYRSQVTQEDLDNVWLRKNPNDLSDGVRGGRLNYEGLNLLKKRIDSQFDNAYDLIHGDLNAIIWEAPPEAPNSTHYDNHSVYQKDLVNYEENIHHYYESPAFREFTAIFHDELKTFYTNPFSPLEQYQLEGVGDGFGINYGASGMGTLLLANRLGIGPSWACKECLYEEFFLQSWANGDPALLEEYFDDPSNVYHSYLNDRVRFRNLHAGPKETHVFHLHAHQWLSASDEDAGSYLDSQTIGPLQGFDYDIYDGGLANYGEGDHSHTHGSGNRNRTPGDSIFHCHLYPHFAQGMWSLWRVHDVLEDGTRRLPDGQPDAELSTYVIPEGSKTRLGTNLVSGPTIDAKGKILDKGTPIPAIVPLPDQALPPLPTYDAEQGLPGYPFYIPGVAGHRAPQPPKDFVEDAGLPRHVFGNAERAIAGILESDISPETGLHRSLALGDFSAEIDTAEIKLLNNDGEPAEKRAMAFHAGSLDSNNDGINDIQVKSVYENYSFTVDHSQKGTYSSTTPNLALAANYTVNGSQAVSGAPFADPCDDPAKIKDVHYEVSAISLDMIVNKAGWHDPQARINVLDSDVVNFENKKTNEAEPFFFRAHSGDCIIYHHSNRTPKDLKRDDFQVKTPTDIIGQHIHLVKFDVTSSDGAANGWNYEDGTLAPDAVHERKCAANRVGGAITTSGVRQILDTHGIDCLAPGASEEEHERIFTEILAINDSNQANLVQTTTQRWFADPILTVGRSEGQGQDQNAWWMGHASNHEQETTIDRTLRTVFNHDHFAPSSIQQHGFYSALLIEPIGSVWTKPDGTEITNQQHPNQNHFVGRGTGWEAIIKNASDQSTHPDHREFALAVADFALLYDPRLSSDDPESQGMGRLLCEAIVMGKSLPTELNWSCPDEVLKEIEEEVAELGHSHAASTLSDGDFQQLAYKAINYWAEHGQPVAPPLKPEAISKNHHDPYLVNYKNEPIPLRIGENTPDPESTNCGANVSLSERQSISFQNSGDDGDMAYIFSTEKHGDPCTPIIEAYEGDEIQIRLVQGAQEVQHMFTVEGMSWNRVIDQNMGQSFESGQKDLAWAKNDNVDNLVATQEIGISEHFEAQLPIHNVGGGEHAKDFLYHFGTADALWNGIWGIIRTYNGQEIDLVSDVTSECADTLLQFTDNRENLIPLRQVLNKPIELPTELQNCLSPIKDRLVALDNNKFGKVEFANQSFDEFSCPLNTAEEDIHFYYAVATRADMLDTRLYYDRGNGIYDPDALVILPYIQDWQGIDSDPESDFDKKRDYFNWYMQYTNGNIEPFVLRVNAGDCVTLSIANWLDGQMATGDSIEEQYLPDHVGDALMPKIVPLNVDSTKDHDSASGTASVSETTCDFGSSDVCPSNKLSFSLPLVFSQNLVRGIGVNDTTFPAEVGQSWEIDFYAGRAVSKRTETPCNEQDQTCEFETELKPYAFGPIPLKAFGDVIGQGSHGLFGAVIVEPKGAVIRDPWSHTPIADNRRHTLGLDAMVTYCEEDTSVEQCPSEQIRKFRDFVVFYQDGLNLHEESIYSSNRPIKDCLVCDDSYDLGEKGVSYRSAPFWSRLRWGTAKLDDVSATDSYKIQVNYIDETKDLNSVEFPVNFFLPSFRFIPTPTYVAIEGQEVKFRVLQPFGRARQRTFTVYGQHYYDMLPQFGSASSALISAGKAITANLNDSIRNSNSSRPIGVQEGCYVYRDGPSQHFSGGVWGSLIVASKEGKVPECALHFRY